MTFEVDEKIRKRNLLLRVAKFGEHPVQELGLIELFFDLFK